MNTSTSTELATLLHALALLESLGATPRVVRLPWHVWTRCALELTDIGRGVLVPYEGKDAISLLHPNVILVRKPRSKRADLSGR